MKISELDLTKISRNPSANPIEIFRRYGWKVLGTGIDGVVAEHPDKPYVLKIFVSSSSYKLFVEYAEQNQKNASVPKFGRTVRTLPGSQWCYRTDEEITDWYKKSDTEKLEILENIKERKNGSKGKRWKIF